MGCSGIMLSSRVVWRLYTGCSGIKITPSQVVWRFFDQFEVNKLPFGLNLTYLTSTSAKINMPTEHYRYLMVIQTLIWCNMSYPLIIRTHTSLAVVILELSFGIVGTIFTNHASVVNDNFHHINSVSFCPYIAVKQKSFGPLYMRQLGKNLLVKCRLFDLLGFNGSSFFRIAGG